MVLSAVAIGVRNSLRNIRLLSTSSVQSKYMVREKEEGDVAVVSVDKVEDRMPIRKDSDPCPLCTCNIPLNVTYQDVLILEQFMRGDGTILPRQLTGLCKKQHLHLERCVMQAHWAGLFPNRTRPDFDRAGYKRFNRYWNQSMDMYRLEEKKEPGTWYYIKRYPTKLPSHISTRRGNSS